ncbi:hypothetical protein [Hyphomicrobium sulfonivorans]|uniref:hypothetical protein n=1 Tax=Hyphomicrobium sulfonivorans TaxID=121290 RepID=UPI00156DF532|nr:hypothetical protein [Hyphomicrobium sulfonivorans]MBI1650940.1 hypothetical protein [Hyphomicrobium sulfonivorans]
MRHFADTFAAMMWGVSRIRNRVAAALALLGVALYAFVIPGHLTSQFNAQLQHVSHALLAEAQLEGAICATDGTDPAAPQTECPICKGVSALQLALAPRSAVTLPVMPHAAPMPTFLHDDLASSTNPVYRSRGPPLPA